MKIVIPLAFAAIFLMAACASPSPEKGDAQTTLAAASAASVHNYRCKSGEKMVAIYPSTDSATVQYKGASHHMRIAVSGSGARYLGDGLEWWTKGSGPGSEGSLLRHKADGTSGDIIELCTAY